MLERADQANVFFTWDWVDLCWRYGFPGKQPFVLVAREPAGQLVGLLPLAGVSHFGLLRTLEVLGCDRAGYPVGDYGGVIAERGFEGEVWAAMLHHLKEMGKWSVI